MADSKKLSLLDSTTIIMGSMIGSGIFIVSTDIVRSVQTPGMLLMAWVVTGVITVLGALSYGELAAMMPKAGGQYIYLKEAYNPMTGFLYGWTLFSVIQTGTIAAVAMAFALFTGVFIPEINNHPILTFGPVEVNTQQLLAVSVIVLLTLYNYRNVKASALMQNIFTITKVAALLALVGLGLYFGFTTKGNSANWQPLFPDVITLATLGIFGAAMTGSLFSADAWNNVTYTAGEVKNPQRNLPLSLFLGTSMVILLYFLANVAYIQVLGADQIAAADNKRLGSVMMEAIFGNNGKWFMAAMIMVSTFGCLNGLIFTAGRVYYAMAKDGLFFKQAAQLNKNNVPAKSLTMQCIWAGLLCFSGTYGKLLGYVMFAVMIFYVLTVVGLFILRIKRPDMERPYKSFGYPILPALYVLLAALVVVVMYIYQREDSQRGLIIMVIGVPVYFVFRRFSKPKAEVVSENKQVFIEN